MEERQVEILLEEGDPAWDGAEALLQAGFLVESRPGLSAREFMRETLGLEDEYIEGTVSTVFIDSEPVDDIDAATLAAGSLIALSGAMPGLVGAVMRRGSPYASFREGISYSRRETAPAAAAGIGEVLIRVKLFNSIMRDHGGPILAKGILVEEDAAAALLAGRPEISPGPGRAGRQGGALLRLRVLKAGGGAA